MILFLPGWFWLSLLSLTLFYWLNLSNKTDILYISQAILTAVSTFLFFRKKYYIFAFGILLIGVADLSYYFQIYRIKRDSNNLLFYFTSSFLYSSGFLLIAKSIFDRVKNSLNVFIIFKISIIPIIILVGASFSFLIYPLITHFRDGTFNFNNLATITEMTTSIPLIVLAYLAIILAHDLLDACISIGALLLGLIDWGIQFEYVTSGSLAFSYYDFFWFFGLLLIFTSAVSEKPVLNYERPKGVSLRARLKILILTASLLPVGTYYFLSHGEIKISISFFLVGAAISLLVASIVDQYFVKQLNILTSEIEQIFIGPTKETYQNLSKEISYEWEESLKIILKNKMFQENLQKTKEGMILQKRAELSAQVAHDIRSPLTALNVAISSIDKLAEDKRILIRNAIQRINDIANDLLTKGKMVQDNIPPNSFTSSTFDNELASTVMLSSLVDMLVSEKRTQYRDQIGIQIGADLSQSYGLFAKLPANELKRVLSNLVNNSVEAFDNGQGKIFIQIKEENDWIKIEVIDNGKGIPSGIIEKLGLEIVSFGKEGTSSGSGLGIQHATKFVSSLGGKIEFLSHPQTSAGTTVSLYIPKCQPPIWFVNRIEIPENSRVIALDDDQSIHSVWQGRLLSLKASEHGIKLTGFTSADIFRSWILSQTDLTHNILFLIDYELLGQKIIGLDIIEELGLHKNSILVSSRYDEKNVYERCKRLGIRIIPKAMAGLVPIEVSKTKTVLDAVLIDDDPLVHMTWNVSAKENQKAIATYKTEIDFFSNAQDIDISTPVIIDLNLGNGVHGAKVAQKVYDLGFKNIFIGTGVNSTDLELPHFIKGILGKGPDWDILLQTKTTLS